MIRTFIAIELSSAAIKALTQLQNRLRAVSTPQTVRWVVPQNIHLTLHFLGDTASEDVEKIRAVMAETASTCPPFTLTLGRLGCFPNTRRVRIVWVDLTGQVETLLTFQQNLGEQLRACIGFSPETRPYSPHLTLGRVKKKLPARHLTQLSQILQQEQSKVGQLANLEVMEVSLIKSELKSGGAVYTPLSREGLGD